MKKLISIIALLTVLAVMVSGCGSQAQDVGSRQDNGQPGPGRQGQFARADLMGEVASVSRNDVSLKLIEVPNMRQNNNQQNNGDPQNDPQANNGQQNGGNRGNGQRGQGGGQFRQMERNYTGETKTVSIPSDVEITTFARGENGRETKKVELKDLKQGDILQIWYADKDKGTISRVSVMSSPANAGNSNNQDNTGK